MDIFGSWRKLVSVVFAKDSQAITLRPNQSTTYTAARDIQLPPGDAAHVLQSADSTATISNKTLDNSNTLNIKDTLWTLQDDGDATKQMRFQLSGITAGQLRTITIPDANQTMANTATAQGFSNKSLDNTCDVTLKDTLFTLQDDGDATKLMRFQLSGLTTGTTRTLTVFDSSHTLLGADTAQVVTNKDIDGGTAANTRRITLPKDTTTNINALTRKQGTVLYDTTTNTVKYDNGSTLTELAAAVTPLTSVTDIINLSITATDDSPGAGDLTIALKTKASTDPNSLDYIQIGINDPTGTSGSYGTKKLTSAASGVTSLVIPSGATMGHTANIDEPLFIYAMNIGGGDANMELCVSTMQLDETLRYSSTALSTGSDSRTVLYSTNAQSNRTVRLIGKLTSNQATPGTWTSPIVYTKLAPINLDYTVKTVTGGFTPTFTGFGSATQDSTPFFYYRVADRMRGQLKITAGTVPAATVGSITLASGITINTAKMFTTAGTSIVGRAQRIRNTASATTPIVVEVFYDGSDNTKLFFAINSQSAVLSKGTTDNIVSNNDTFYVEFDIPVTAWAV